MNDQLMLDVLRSLNSGGCIYRHTDHAQVYPIYSGCEWDAYNIDLSLFNHLYISGLITEHYDPMSFQFQFYDITPAGSGMVRPNIKRESWQTGNAKWGMIQ